MVETKQYKCPCCGGSLSFDSGVQKLKCPYCDTEFATSILKDYDEDLQAELGEDIPPELPKGSEWQEGEELAVYSCQSCGGEIVAEPTTVATACPFCESPVVFGGGLKGDLRPDLVIPFKLDKKAAKEAMKKHLQGKRLLPKAFKEENHIDEIKGLYVPFWLFDADVSARVQMRAQRTRHWSDRNYDYTEIRHYSVVRGGELKFENIPVDGSSKMDDALMESIEPFNMKEGVDFSTAYLAGYLADRYDVPEQESISRAQARIKNSAEEEMRATVGGYHSVTVNSSQVQTKGGSSRYALLPVWILNTTWKDKKYVFAMNGQNGKFVGNLPMDLRAFFLWLFGLGLSFAVLAGVLMYFISLFPSYPLGGGTLL